MNDTACEPGTYTQVYVLDGGCFDVQDSPDRVDAIVTEYRASGGTRDTFVHLTTEDGDPLRVLASQIVGIGVSTPQGRARAILIAKARSDEYQAARIEAGYPPGDDY
jgi:hypothetical protein